MPLKDFVCEACGHKFEALVWIKEPDPTACEKCGKGPLKQLLGTFRVAGMGKKSAPADDPGAGGGDDAGLGDMGGGMDGMNGMMGGGGDDFGGAPGGMGEDMGGDDSGDFGGAGDEEV